jgi:hypothetical protein
MTLTSRELYSVLRETIKLTSNTMKRIIWLLLLAIALLNSCNVGKDNKFTVELIVNNPYVIKINNFNWNKDHDQVIGDFTALDKEVYDLLKDKNGICELYMQHNTTFDNSNNAYDYIGFLIMPKAGDRSGSTWEDFHNKGGIRIRIEQHLLQPTSSDTVKTINPTTDTTKLIKVAKTSVDTAIRLDDTTHKLIGTGDTTRMK